MMKDDFLAEVGASLRGPRRHRKRLVDELAAHIDDAVRAELAANAHIGDAERTALDRIGNAREIADRWNGDRRILRARRHRRLAAVTFVLVIAGALGVTQYAAGKSQPPRHDPPAETTPKRPAIAPSIDRSDPR